MKLLIIVPAYNEAENIDRVVKMLKERVPQYDYIIVNDGSRDRTAAICRAKGYPLLDLPVNLGLTGAIQAGMRYAYEMGYDAAIQIDGDGQHDPSYIPEMARRMEQEGCDLTIGSRFVTEKRPRSLRMLGNTIIGAAVRLTTGKVLSDPTSGMRLFSRDLIRCFAYELNFGPEPDTISYLLRCGARMSEIQVSMQERVAGESYLTLGRSIKYMMEMCISIVVIQRFRTKIELRKGE